MDGSTDFSRLSEAALGDALARVDPALNPLDWEAARVEARRRKLRRRSRMLPVMERVVGWYLLLGALVGLANTAAHFPSWTSIILPAISLPLLLWGASGVLLLRRIRFGRVLGLVALGFQLLSVSYGVMDYHFSPVYSLAIAWINSNVVILFHLGPEAYLRIGKVVPVSVAIDLVPAYGMVILWRSIARSHRASHQPGAAGQ